jgi:signal transduction histidine kinase
VGHPDDAADVHVTVAASGGDDPPGHQILFVDRTEEVLRDREIERQGRLAALGATLSGVAHELKNPLQVIGAYAELALEPGAPAGETTEALETILGQSRRMKDLIQELLGFSRRGAAKSAVRLEELIGEILRIQRVARGRAVRFEETLRWRGEVEASGAKVEQILINLVSNAVDAVPAGQGVVEVRLMEVDGDAVVTVADNGPGIPPDLADRIFDPFISTKPEGEGTGLGLAICRRLASSMGAELTAGNRPEGGAVFTLRIPVGTPGATRTHAQRRVQA